MRPSSASSERRPPRPPEPVRAGSPIGAAASGGGSRARGLALALALVLAAGAGCVTSGTHEQVVAERDRLASELGEARERIRRLEASKESLSSERVALIDSLEDLRQARAELEERVEALESRRADLSERLESRQQELGRMRETYRGLVDDLEAEVTAGRIQIERLRDGIRMNLPQAILFPSGEAELDAEGRKVLAKVAPRLGDIENRIEVRGHTDDVPIRGALAERYPTNWELAAARAASVVRLLAQEGVDAERMIAVSHGAQRPRAPNDTPKGRARNRRIEIRLLPIDGAEPEAPAEAGPGGAGPEGSGEPATSGSGAGDGGEAGAGEGEAGEASGS